MMKERMKAFLQAVILYMFLYIAIVHVFVLWKWETANADGRYTVVKTINPDLPEILVEWAAEKESQRSSLADLEQFHQIMKGHLARHQGTLLDSDKAKDVLNEYLAKIEKWQEVDIRLPEGNHTFQNLRLYNLLQFQSLSRLTEEGFKSLFDYSLADLQAIVDRKYETNWRAVHEMFTPKSPFPKKEKLTLDSLKQDLCTLPAIDDDDDEEEVEDEKAVAEGGDDDEEMQKALSMYALEEDVATELDNLKAYLEERAQDPLAHVEDSSRLYAQISRAAKLLTEQFTLSDRILASAVEEASENIANKMASNTHNSGCPEVSEDHISKLMEAGLDALARKKDVREALLKVLEQIDPEAAKGLILDADLDTDHPIPQLPSPEEFPLILLLNSPMTLRLAALVDGLLDILGGHFDPWDHYVDRLSEQVVDVHNKDANSLGKVFLTNLLVRSGHLKIPIPTALRQFLESKPRGKKFLAALT